MAGDTPIRSVAVVGTGLIGASWAGIFLAGGLDVTAWDPSADARADLPARAERIAGLVADLAGGTVTGRLRVVDDLATAVAHADLIQENAPEIIAVKADLYRAIEEASGRDAVLASSTSSFSWSELSGTLRSPERFVIAHPFNPVHLIPLVEIYGSRPDVVDRAAAFYAGVGKSPVRLKKEAVGHLANRLSSALWREAVNLVVEGIADVEDIDRALVDGPGLRWSVIGTHMGYHLGGGPGGIQHYLDHLGASQERRWSLLGTPKLDEAARKAIVAGVAAEAKGRSIPDLEQERDAMLAAILKLRRTRSGGTGT